MNLMDFRRVYGDVLADSVEIEVTNDQAWKTIRQQKQKLLRYVGKIIKDVTLHENTLELKFGNGHSLHFWDEMYQCCELRYLHTSDDLRSFVGSKFLGTDVLVADMPPPEHSCSAHSCDVCFLQIKTDSGILTVNAYNEHDGNYAGFELAVWSDEF